MIPKPRSRTPGRLLARRFALAMAACALALLGLRHGGLLTDAPTPWSLQTARATAAVLDGSGLEVHRQGTVLSHPAGFSYQICDPCTGLTTAAFLVAGLLALPGRRRSKLLGCLLGVSLVLAVNLLRLVHLFYLGVRHPSAFDFMHRPVWEVSMLALMMAFWLCWLWRTAVGAQKHHLVVTAPRSDRRG